MITLSRTIDYLMSHLDNTPNKVLLIAIIILWMINFKDRLKPNAGKLNADEKRKSLSNETPPLTIVLYILMGLFAVKLIFDLL
jgi:hypothetical protein